jgi:hypothetical protein
VKGSCLGWRPALPESTIARPPFRMTWVTTSLRCLGKSLIRTPILSQCRIRWSTSRDARDAISACRLRCDRQCRSSPADRARWLPGPAGSPWRRSSPRRRGRPSRLKWTSRASREFLRMTWGAVRRLGNISLAGTAPVKSYWQTSQSSRAGSLVLASCALTVASAGTTRRRCLRW